MDETLLIEDIDEADRGEALDILRGATSSALSTEHSLQCPADQPPALVRTIHTVMCPDCAPSDDIRTAIRYARHPTQYAERLFANDDAHWLRIFALVVAAAVSHLEDPYGLPYVLRDL